MGSANVRKAATVKRDLQVPGSNLADKLEWQSGTPGVGGVTKGVRGTGTGPRIESKV